MPLSAKLAEITSTSWPASPRDASAARPRSTRIESLQQLRAVAALMVVAYHTAFRAGDEHAFFVGAAGVDIFFVVSGCVMWLSHVRSRHDAGTFVAHRIARIVPLYWLVTLLYLAIGLAAPALYPWSQVRLDEVLLSLLFVPYRSQLGDVLPVVAPGWTLNLEIFFYLVFAITVAWLGSVRLMAATLAALALSGLAVAPQCGWICPSFYLNGLLVEFAAGVLLGRWWLQPPSWFGSRALALALVAAAIAVLAGTQLLGWFPTSARVAGWGLPAAALACGLMMLERQRRLPGSRLLGVIGDSSYSLYLLHTLVLAVVYKVVQPSLPVLLLATVTIACVVAHLSFTWVEKPGARLVLALHARWRGHPPSRIAA